MTRLVALLSILLVAGCDSSGGGGDGPGPDPNDPSGTFTIEPIWFRLSRVAAPDVGGVEDLQAWIEGTVTLAATNGALAGSGSCTIRRRQHKAWIPETTDQTVTQAFTASGSITDGEVDLTLQGCAWVMARYRGTFGDGTYDLALKDLLSAPAWNPDIYSSSTQLDGDDPRGLLLARGD